MVGNDDALTAQDVSQMLGIGKNAVYEMAKAGKLRSYRIGRKIRFTSADVADYIRVSHTEAVPDAKERCDAGQPRQRDFIICGQDIILDVLSNYLSQAGVSALRSYVGSYDALAALYKDEVQVASTHLWDGDTGEYNAPYVKRLLPGIPTVIVHLTYRTQGLYVAKGNPRGRADVAVGSEKIARQVEGIDFVPLQRERYDLVLKKEAFDSRPVRKMMGILESGILRDEFAGLGGYDTSQMGKILAL